MINDQQYGVLSALYFGLRTRAIPAELIESIFWHAGQLIDVPWFVMRDALIAFEEDYSHGVPF